MTATVFNFERLFLNQDSPTPSSLWRPDSYVPARPEVTAQRFFQVGDGQQIRPRLTGESLGDREAGDATHTREMSHRSVPLIESGPEPDSHGLGDPGPVVLLHDGLRPHAVGAVSARRQTAGISLRHEVKADPSGPPRSHTVATTAICYSNNIPPAGVFIWRHVMTQRINSYRPAGAPAGWSPRRRRGAPCRRAGGPTDSVSGTGTTWRTDPSWHSSAQARACRRLPRYGCPDRSSSASSPSAARR